MRKKISVAMAVYNGETYIKEQLGSILNQLHKDDEIIISLDPSNDKTVQIIDSFNDQRIKVINGPGKGLILNFENAIKHTHNEIIFLCDQDDVWLPNKVDTVLTCFEDQKINVILHNAKIVDKDLNVIENSFFDYRKTR